MGLGVQFIEFEELKFVFISRKTHYYKELHIVIKLTSCSYPDVAKTMLLLRHQECLIL